MIAVKVENLSKSYLVGHNAAKGGRYTTLRDVIGRNVKGFARKTLDMIQGRPIIQGDVVEEFLALKDLNFEIQQGDRVGIIGRNGAGKSTLLKLLSRITEPTKGRITINGRVASLLEVGTGFHPELTGRENIYLNGAILGMSRVQIKSKFDEIVDFSGVEKFLDTPVKRYSSGMYVRLAFAVAAHLESDIIVVDEVLAVGDAEFQKKCLGKMGEVSKGEGRTVLFVSHNMAAMQALCSKAFLLNDGKLVQVGTPPDVVSSYLNVGSKTLNNRNLSQISDRKGEGRYLRFISFDVVGSDGYSLSDIPCGNKVTFELNFQVFSNEINNLRVGIIFKDQNTGNVVTDLNSYYGSKEVLSCKKGNHKYLFTINRLPLAPNQYNVGFIATSGLQVLDWLKDVYQLTVSEGLFYESGQMPIDKNSQIFFTEYTCGMTRCNESTNN